MKGSGGIEEDREREEAWGSLAMRGKIYAAGIYARLSVDSHNEKNESIEAQIEIAREYLEKQGDMQLFGCYTDLGRSGTHFRREGFHRLMEDIRARRVDCVIVKDFSRFGRDYIETGNYIQRIFPFMGVRFVSVTDGYDSLSGENDELGMNLKNLINELYARDISVKVKSSKQAKRDSGGYTGGAPPYGYRIEDKPGRRTGKGLIESEEAADIVRRIYNLYDSGETVRGIVRWLYQENIHRPTEYRKYGHVYRQGDEELVEWTAGTVRSILSNPVYIGCLVRSGNGERRRGSWRKEELENACQDAGHYSNPGIIGEEQFFRAAGRMGRREKACQWDEETEDAFEGILFCGDCGKRMGRLRLRGKQEQGGRTEYAYFCRNSGRMDGRRCEKRHITSGELKSLIRCALKLEAGLNGITEETFRERSGAYHKIEKKTAMKQRNEIHKKKARHVEKSGRMYQKYRRGEMSAEAFLDWKEEDVRELLRLEERLRHEEAEAAAKEQRLLRRAEEALSLLRDSSRAAPGREYTAALISGIKVYPERRVEIHFCFEESVAVMKHKRE